MSVLPYTWLARIVRSSQPTVLYYGSRSVICAVRRVHITSCHRQHAETQQPTSTSTPSSRVAAPTYVYPLVGDRPLNRSTHAINQYVDKLFNAAKVDWTLQSTYHTGLLNSHKPPKLPQHMPPQQRAAILARHAQAQESAAAGAQAAGILKHKQYVVFAGRSNVGKSSLINTLLSQTVARVSSRPGKTQQVYTYIPVQRNKQPAGTGIGSGGGSVISDLCVCDIPGYGYGTAPIKVVSQWNELLSQMLTQTAAQTTVHDSAQSVLRCVYILIDVRRGIQDIDREFIQFIQSFSTIAYHIILTKSDKLSPVQLQAVVDGVRGELTGEQYVQCVPQVIVTSSAKKLGVHELRCSIVHMTQE